MLPKIIENKILEILNTQFKRELRIFAIKPVVGGDINAAAKLITSMGNFFVKWNDANKFPGMFQKEAKGLKKLKEAECIKIPEIIGADEAENYSFLLLEFIEQGKTHNNFWSEFGTSLAKLHQNTHDYFGLDHDNYIGSLHQSNAQHDNWITFFIEERLQTQLRLAYDSNLLNKDVLKATERLFKVLNEIFPKEPSALLHGDLWSGNFMIDFEGNPCLVDPAVYYGHREVDIAMTRLFGGFSNDFYSSYNNEWPMENNWEDRMDIYNLYPLLVHVNLCGGGYVSQVNSILSRC